MNKEEILEKSRMENKNKDIYEKEILKSAGNIGVIVAISLATVFFLIQIIAGGGINYGLYAIVLSFSATNFIVKGIKLKRRHEIVIAVMYIILVAMLSAGHIYNLLTSAVKF